MKNKKNAAHSWVHVRNFFVQEKLDSFVKPALLRSQTNTTSESSTDK
jgi:hypothetical protein